MTGKQRLIAASVAVVLILFWALIAFWIGPSEIARAHRGDSLPFINDALAGRGTIPLEDYLASWRRLSMELGGLLFGLLMLGYGALELLASSRGRRARERMAERFRLARDGGASWPFAAALLVALWLGLISGAIEALHTVVTHRLSSTIEVDVLSHGFEDIWMAPLVTAVLLGLLAVLLHLPRLRWRRLVLDRFLIFSLAAVAFYGLGRSTLAGVHPVAVLLLAAGAASQVVRLLTGRPGLWRRIVGVSTLWLLATLGGWTAAAYGTRWLSQNRQLAALSAATAGSPNILLIVLDTVRAQSLGLYGYGRATSPALDSIAASGIVFARAMTPTSWTLPSHASMFTGRWAHELSTDWESRFDDTYPTLAEWLAARGYVTGGFAANVGYCGPDFGLQRGFIHYDARPNSINFVLGSSWLGQQLTRIVKRRLQGSHQDLVRVRASEISQEFLTWLDKVHNAEGGRPFFAFLNLYDAHAPYLPPEPWHQKFARPGARYWTGQPEEKRSAQTRQDLIDSYDSSIAYTDHELGLLMQQLARSGALDNTIVIITSDHGEEFAEHGVYQHGQSLYLPSLHVPLVLLWPGRVPAGLTLHEPVSVRSIPATITRLVAGEEDPVFPGLSLSHRWEAASSHEQPSPALLALLSMRDHLPESSPAGRGDVESILVDGLHYIRVDDGGEELFDVIADPWETSDLGGTERGSLEMRRLAETLSAATRADGKR